MDLGTANTIITTNGKIVVDEPSVVALDRRTDKTVSYTHLVCNETRLEGLSVLW